MANVRVSLTGDESKLLRSLQNVIDKEVGLRNAVADTGKASREAAAKAKKRLKEQEAASKRAGDAVGRIALQYLGVGAAIGVAKKALTELNAERRRGAEGLKAGELGSARLAQLTTSPKKFQQLLAGARKTRRQEGVGVEAATALQFELESAGFGAERETFASLHQLTGGKAPAVTQAAAKLKKAFKLEGPGTGRSIINQALLAAGPVPGAGLSDILLAGTTGADVIGRMGGTIEETLSFLSILGQAKKNPRVAGERLEQLASSLAKRGFKGGLVSAVKQARRKLADIESAKGIEPSVFREVTLKDKFGRTLRDIHGKPRKELQEFVSPELKKFASQTKEERELEFFGEKGGLEAFSIVEKRLPEIEAAIKASKAAGAAPRVRDRLSRSLGILGLDPNSRRAKAVRVAAERRKLAEEEEFGGKELTVEAVLENEAARAVERDIGVIGRLSGGATRAIAGFFGADPENVEAFGRVAEGIGPAQLEQLLRGLDSNTDAQNRGSAPTLAKPDEDK